MLKVFHSKLLDQKISNSGCKLIMENLSMEFELSKLPWKSENWSFSPLHCYSTGDSFDASIKRFALSILNHFCTSLSYNCREYRKTFAKMLSGNRPCTMYPARSDILRFGWSNDRRSHSYLALLFRNEHIKEFSYQLYLYVFASCTKALEPFWRYIQAFTNVPTSPPFMVRKRSQARYTKTSSECKPAPDQRRDI